MVQKVVVLLVAEVLEDLVVVAQRVIMLQDNLALNHHKILRLLLIPTLINMVILVVSRILVLVETLHLMVAAALAVLVILILMVVLVEMVAQVYKFLQHLEIHQINMEQQVQEHRLDGSLAVEEEQTQITQVLQLMDLPLELVVRVLTEQLLMLVEVQQDKLHLQVQQPSTHKVEEQTPEVVAVEVTRFQELPQLKETL
tara:strand:+ start:287 stop:883 length:597 start_codon:yes stop_codon:yes gene_type:complete